MRPEVRSLLRDVSYAVRGMCKSPRFTFIGIATLGLGIGLCTVIYAFLNVATRPLPGVPEPE
jgi:uncharacterized membrane protein